MNTIFKDKEGVFRMTSTGDSIRKIQDEWRRIHEGLVRGIELTTLDLLQESYPNLSIDELNEALDFVANKANYFKTKGRVAT